MDQQWYREGTNSGIKIETRLGIETIAEIQLGLGLAASSDVDMEAKPKMSPRYVRIVGTQAEMTQTFRYLLDDNQNGKDNTFASPC
ncbi:hypothetical protein EVAR_81973_1 [Eumeta japonica]|uniref:Uncharacterized protein n=1 Tax=Eumeta variegata TaxID=151549 RepID=A0A4C1VUW7_EUMVA|nr:hypothetical protein EVAR_81973_1 [Eumeta japonica]